MAFSAALACFPGKSPIAAESEAQAGYELSRSSDSSSDSYSDSFLDSYSDSYAGLLAKARNLRARVIEQPEAVLEANDWIGVIDEQITFVLRERPALAETSETGQLQAISSVPSAQAADIRRRTDALDHIAELLEWLQSQAIYPSRAEFSVPSLIVGKSAEFSQTFAVPDLPLEGAIFVVASLERLPFRLQALDNEANNFVSVTTTGEASLELEAYSITNGGELFPAARVVEGALSSGDTVTIRYQNFQVPERTQANFILPVYLVYPEFSQAYAIPADGLAIVADKPVSLRSIAPSIVTPGQNFEVNVQLVDRFGNRSFGATPSLDLLVDGVFRQRIDRSNRAEQSFMFNLDEPGIRQLALRSGGGGLRTSVNPIDVVRDSKYQLEWIDLSERGRRGQAPLGFLSNGSLAAFELEAELIAGGNTVVLTRAPGNFETREAQVFALSDSDIKGRSGDQLHMAVPYAPTDIRAFSPAAGRLVEIISGDATFTEFGTRHALQGNKIGFTGSASSNQMFSEKPAVSGATAVWFKSGESIFEALAESRTYVTSGAKILLDVEVNGGMPGSRVVNDTRRIISGRVSGTNGIVAVELLKNGLVVDRITYGSETLASDEIDETITEDIESNKRDDKKQQLRVSFYSSSAPHRDQVDYPRNGREWIGYLKLTGGDLQRVSAPGFRNKQRQGIAMHPTENNRVDFITWTRGQESSFLVQADMTDDNAVFEINLKEGREDQASKPSLRKPANFAGSRQLLSLAELQNGPIDRIVEVEGYDDRIRFELIDQELPTSQMFQFQDNDVKNAKAGDFYHVRAIQLDDHFAISSPVWVGGFDVFR
jgi:hypothetical protein